MIKVLDKSRCSGCSACMNICPQKCIQMEYDNEGFYYPMIDNSMCIGCNMCDKVCPYNNSYENRSTNMVVYGCNNNDDDARRISTSGGMFAAIAEYILSLDGVVFGATYDENMHVVHGKAETIDEVRKLQGSKYVQSELGNIFLNVSDLLNCGRYVFFTGTPCQVEGLYYYLKGRDISKLITADIKCYGVPSSKLFDKFQEYLNSLFESKVKNFYFRDKKYGYSGVNVKVVLENGRNIEDKLVIKTYSKTMFSKIGLRRSCYNCDFIVRNKIADFTLGDMWNIKDFDKQLDDEKGTTCVEINTNKGIEIFNEIKECGSIRTAKIAELAGDELIRFKSKQQRSYLVDEDRRTEFFNDMNTLPYDKLMDKHFKNTWKNKLDNIGKPILNRIPGARIVFRAKKLNRARVDYKI